MENASKALIIAGAILLSILIIAIGMYIYNSSQNSIAEAGSQIDAQERQNFNQQWEMYEGKQSGSNVRALISKLASNAKANEDEASRLPDLAYDPDDTGYVEVVSEIGDNINIAGFNTARTAIQARHQYTVELHLNGATALVDGIIVKYEDDDAAFDAWTSDDVN